MSIWISNCAITVEPYDEENTSKKDTDQTKDQ